VRPLADAAGEELIWGQPKALKRTHELRAGDEVIATLTFQRGSLAEAEAADGHWTFKRQGFWQPRVSVRLAGSDADIAIFSPRWTGGGTLEPLGGKPIRFSSGNFWQTQWVWQETEEPLIRFKGRQGIMRASGQVEVNPDATGRPDLSLLVLLGWYLILLHAEDSAAASSAATVAVVASS